MSDAEKRRLLKVKRRINEKRPKFEAFESWRYKKIKPRWRKPRGIDNKMRTNEKGWPKSVNVGWRSPAIVRGLHPSGKEEIAVNNINDLKKINKDTQVARIGRGVGKKKKAVILEEANKAGIKVLNPGSKTQPSEFDNLEEEKQ